MYDNLTLVEKIYKCNDKLEYKKLDYFLSHYYQNKNLEDLEPYQQEKILDWLISCKECEADNISSWALENGYF